MIAYKYHTSIMCTTVQDSIDIPITQIPVEQIMTIKLFLNGQLCYTYLAR